MLDVTRHWTSFDWLLMGTIGCLAVLALGLVSNAVLKHNGFGIVVNGLLLLVGLLTGAFARAVTIGFQ